MTAGGGLVRLLLDVLGIYSTFLLWGLLQEKLGTTPYDDPLLGKPRYFRSVLLLNTVQSAISTLCALLYLLARKTSHESLKETLALNSAQNRLKSPKLDKPSRPKPSQSTFNMLASILQCALLHSMGSPFAFASLRHIDYPTMILGKSCKLVPVMLMNILLYRRRFAFHKYLVVAMVTIGISVFTFYHPKGNKGSKVEQSSLFGLSLLLASLTIDGATNSTQDEIFARHRISGSQMMFFMNLFATIITTLALILPLPSIPLLGYISSGQSELSAALAFIHAYPAVLKDILAYSLAGALGQLFIFDTLQHYGSLTLVTITVTRKLFTMLLSVFVYKHRLNAGQWLGVALVFAAIGLEAQVKRQSFKQVVKQDESKARLKSI